MKSCKRIVFSLVFLMITLFSELAQADFDLWLADFKKEALNEGISQVTLDKAFDNIVPIPQVIKLDRSQPEFILPFSDYIHQRVTPQQIAIGRKLLLQHQDLFDAIENEYGIPRSLLVAFWGMETNYGRNKGNINTPAALATLAHDGRRQDFFRTQLMDALRILEAGNVTPSAMRGSWAGAMGHMQFMPTTYMRYGVDADNNGHIDVWQSIPDAMFSAANYLSSIGWMTKEPAAIEVQLPRRFAWQDAQLTLRKPVSEWLAMGVTAINHQALPALSDDAAIILPQGWQGPAFMVFRNFDVIMDWNHSVNYALSVVNLARRYHNDTAIVGGQYAETGALSYDQMMALQTYLNERSFDAGTPDGFPGLKTQAAIRLYQASVGLPADGYASPSLLSKLQGVNQ